MFFFICCWCVCCVVVLLIVGVYLMSFLFIYRFCLFVWICKVGILLVEVVLSVLVIYLVMLEGFICGGGFFRRFFICLEYFWLYYYFEMRLGWVCWGCCWLEGVILWWIVWEICWWRLWVLFWGVCGWC